MGTSAPRVSVVIATYNRGALLQESVRSVVAQTFADWELILVDDGSTDPSGVQAVEALSDARIRVIRTEHTGNPAIAMNIGAAAARGEWLAFLGSDDLLSPEKLEVQLAALRASPAAEWSSTDHTFIDGAGQPTHQRIGVRYSPESGWILGKLLRQQATVCIITVLVRRSTFDRVGRFDEAFVFRQDLDLMLRLAGAAEVLGVAQPLAAVREHADRNTKRQAFADLVGWNARVYQKTASWVNDRSLRRICHAHSAAHQVSQARALSKSGAHRRALSAIATALQHDPTSAAAWRVAAGCVVRAFGVRWNTAPVSP